jgi:hypothetical protein
LTATSDAPRGATNPPRGLEEADLAKLDRQELRYLCRSLLIESGFRVIESRPVTDHEEVTLQVAPAWRPREARARVAYRAVEQRDVDELAELVVASDFSEAILIEAGPGDGSEVDVPPTVHVIRAPDLIHRLELSALVNWHGSVPSHDRDMRAAVQAVDDAAPYADRLGLRVLPILARNKPAPELVDAAEAPDKLFERLGFRVFTHVFRCGGERMGAERPGEVLPDSLLASPAGAPVDWRALVDFKAARDGWLMSHDDGNRFQEYAKKCADHLGGSENCYMLIVSSEFQGATGDRHPFHARAETLQREAKLHLVYLRAVDLVQVATRVEAHDLSPAARQQISWHHIFAGGLVGEADLAAVAAAGGGS